MPKLRPRLPGDGNRFGPLIDVNPGERPATDREKIAQLETDNLDLMLALTSVYEANLTLEARIAQLEGGTP